jgi:hypothetical protein
MWPGRLADLVISDRVLFLVPVLASLKIWNFYNTSKYVHMLETCSTFTMIFVVSVLWPLSMMCCEKLDLEIFFRKEYKCSLYRVKSCLPVWTTYIIHSEGKSIVMLLCIGIIYQIVFWVTPSCSVFLNKV